jgi:predicted phage baseplate assembly protein
MVIAGNVAFSTHGASVSEVLGSGDASLVHQRFTLRQAPMTFTPAGTPSGGESSLEIWVNDVRWSEVPTLFARGPRERIYVARRANEGEVTVTFGDGTNGARLPTGHENVRALYRKGIGLEGLVNAGQLTLLMTRPLGVKDVINPLAASGAADPQELQDARRNAPLTVLTLDRLVSLQDYEDFSRNFSGVAKALASWTWSVGSRGIFMTVSGPAGAAVVEGTATEQQLIEALREFGNPRLPVVVKSFRPVTFCVAGTVFAAPDRVADDVLAAVREALLAHFSFEVRDFGQPVALSEVVGVMQNVPGVIAIDLDALFFTGNASERKTYLAAAKPKNGASSASAAPAELLTIDPASLQALKVQTAS